MWENGIKLADTENFFLENGSFFRRHVDVHKGEGSGSCGRIAACGQGTEGREEKNRFSCGRHKCMTPYYRLNMLSQ